jgi:hypothetical protein
VQNAKNKKTSNRKIAATKHLKKSIYNKFFGKIKSFGDGVIFQREIRG